MSGDLEAGTAACGEERGSLSAFTGDVDGNESESIEMVSPRLEIPEKNVFDEIQDSSSNSPSSMVHSAPAAEGESESIMKLDLCARGTPGAIHVIKGERWWSREVGWFSRRETDWTENIIFIYDTDVVPQSTFDLLKKIPGQKVVITSLSPNKVSDMGEDTEIFSILSTSAFTGNAMSDEVQAYAREDFFVAPNRWRHSDLGFNKEDIKQVPKNYHLMTVWTASKHELFEKILSLARILSSGGHSIALMTVINNGSKDILQSMANGHFFEPSLGILVTRNGGSFSAALYSFIEACKNESEMLENAKKGLISICKEYISESDGIDLAMVIDNIRKNVWTFYTYDEANDDMANAVMFAISKCPLFSTSILMDSSKETLEELSDDEYFKNNLKTVIFERAGGLPEVLSRYLQEGIYNTEFEYQKYFFEFNFKPRINENFIRNISENVSKLESNDRSAHFLVSRAPSPFTDVLERPLLKEFTLPHVYQALRSDSLPLLKDVLDSKKRIEIDTYIYCFLRFHWHDSSAKHEHLMKVAEHFNIPCYASQTLSNLVSAVNGAIAKLSNGIMADCVNDDGTPNLGIITPIQALIINRIFCLQLDIVKMLWEYDTQNIIVNAVMIWILLNGIIKEKKYSKAGGLEALFELRDYVASAIKQPLDGLFHHRESIYSDVLEHRLPLFKGNALYKAAADAKFLDFLSHTATKRCISAKWSKDKRILKKRYHSKLKLISAAIRQPMSKLYIHMITYVMFYVMLAYSTLQPKSKATGILQWFLFVIVFSFSVDELRQALGNKHTIKSSLERWWADSWNKLDIVTIMLYYIGFGLECGGVINGSHLLFSIFSFIWCLKFYQFLRAFESLGIYIILIQKMIPQLKNFAVVVLIAMVSYGIFMTSILFPKIELNSWSVFIMIMLRPYLLLFAETGINEYGLSSKSTIYNTPKVQTASEILTILGMCVFLMFGSVLLLNLLIAIFSGIYEEVKEQSEKLWTLNSVELLQEFQNKPLWPIPFSLPINIFFIIRRLKKGAIFNVKGVDYKGSIARRYQEEAVEQIVKLQEKEQATCESVIRHIDTRVAKLQNLYQSKYESQHGESIQKHSSEIPEIINKTVDQLLLNTTRIAAAEKKIEQKIENIETTVTTMGARIVDVEEKMEERIKKVEIQCQEISSLLKYIISRTEQQDP